MIPSLVLFVYLILETAKLSREKIRHQFAVDTAAFIELTNYSDLLNRMAYVNGSFPMRVFRESYGGVDIEATSSSSPKLMLQFLYENAAFPDNAPGTSDLPNLDPEERWPIKYVGQGQGDVLNGNTPTDTGAAHVFRQRDAEQFWLWYDVHSVPLWQFWTNVYELLGSVADAQYAVYKRLTGANSFYKKAWMLNTGLNSRTAEADAFSGKALQLDCIYTKESGTYGRFMREGSWINVGEPTGTKGFGRDTSDSQNPYRHQGSGSLCNGGLFRVAVIQKSVLDRVRITGLGSGVEVKQRWTAPNNYFNVALNSPRRPEVHVRAGVVGCCVWAEESPGSPTPTPKFQTRVLP